MAVLTIGLLLGCRDESKNPTLEPEFGAYAKGQFLDATNAEIPTIFGAYSQTTVNGSIFWDKTNTNETTATTNVKGQVTWNAGKDAVVINKIEIYVQLIESYADKNNNVITKSHGPAATPTVPEGKLWKTIDAGARLAPAAFAITPSDVYSLYKGTLFDYKGTGTAVDIFENNPFEVTTGGGSNPSRKVNRFQPGGRVYTIPASVPLKTVTLLADNISIKWRLLASDGRTFGSWHNNVCTQLTDANCSILFTVK